MFKWKLIRWQCMHAFYPMNDWHPKQSIDWTIEKGHALEKQVVLTHYNLNESDIVEECIHRM